MAYIDFSADAGGLNLQASAAQTAPAAPRHDPLPTGAAALSALEWSVVAIAYGDGLASLRRPGRLAVALGTVFGSNNVSPLADPKLEALRRMAVMSWHYGDAVAASEVDAFLAAGYTGGQYETMLASIGSARSNRKRRA